jgi:hypothetical protein
MRTLVVGLYPPPASEEARGTMAMVRYLAKQDHDVEVMAQPYSAAQHRARIDGPAGAWAMYRQRRRYDEIYVMIEAVLRYPAGRFGRYTRIIDTSMWATALRRTPNACLVVNEPGAIPGSVGGRTGRMLWEAAPRLLVPNEYTGRMLVEQGGAPADRVQVAEVVSEYETGRWNTGWSGVTDQIDAVALIRRRAAEDRRADEG